MRFYFLLAWSRAVIVTGDTANKGVELQTPGKLVWSPSSSAKKCPVHLPPQVSWTDNGSAIVLNIASSSKRFSQAELDIQSGSLSGSSGLNFTFSSTDLTYFKLKIRVNQHYSHFEKTVPISGSSSSKRSVWVPWTDLKAHSRRRRKYSSGSGGELQPETIHTIAMTLPVSSKAAQITLFSVFASDSKFVSTSPDPGSPLMATDFVGPFTAMGITGHNDLGRYDLGNPGECAAMCKQDPQCKSFDWGARNSVEGECWLSTANRASAGSAYTRWEHYDYYELRETTAAVSTTKAISGGTPLMATEFVGPFTAMGITGHNDLGRYDLETPSECATMCKQTPQCNSFDWGAREHVKGECWLSTANRASAGSAYTRWKLYDYYELQEPKAAVATTPAMSVVDGTDTAMVDFLGPSEGVDISENSDLGVYYLDNPAECALFCKGLADCRSFDWGARDYVVGECWLSTAHRATAASEYTNLRMYDYYELNKSSRGVASMAQDDPGKQMSGNSSNRDASASVRQWGVLPLFLVVGILYDP